MVIVFQGWIPDPFAQVGVERGHGFLGRGRFQKVLTMADNSQAPAAVPLPVDNPNAADTGGDPSR